MTECKEREGRKRGDNSSKPEECNSASSRNQSGKQDGLANRPGLRRFEELPRTDNFRAKTNKVPTMCSVRWV